MVSRVERGPVADWMRTADRWLIGSFIALMVIGLVMALAASPAVAERLNLSTFHFVNRQALMLIPTAALMIATSFLSPRHVRRAALVTFAASFALIILALMFGAEVKGARRWIFGLQPSEFIKPAFVVLAAWAFTEGGRTGSTAIPAKLLSFLLLPIAIVPLILEPDFGQTMLVAVVWTALFFLAGLHWFWVVAVGGMGMAGGFAVFKLSPHVHERVLRFLDPDSTGGLVDTFQVDTALQSILSGGWLGRGPGEGVYKRILPDAHTDFVFAVTGEEFGMIACMALIAFFAFIVLRALVLAARNPDPFCRLAAAGLTVMFARAELDQHGGQLARHARQGNDLAVHLLRRLVPARARPRHGLPDRDDAQAAGRRSRPSRGDGGMSSARPILLAAGGTGGHLFPAAALAGALTKRGAEVELATDSRALKFGGDFPARATHAFPAATTTDAGALAKARASLTLGAGLAAAAIKLRRIRPRAVVGFGGYPTVPPLLAAWLLRIPTILHEQNAVMGRANRFLSPRVNLIACGFPGLKGVDRSKDPRDRKPGSAIGDRRRCDPLSRTGRTALESSGDRRLAGSARHGRCGACGDRVDEPGRAAMDPPHSAGARRGQFARGGRLRADELPGRDRRILPRFAGADRSRPSHHRPRRRFDRLGARGHRAGVRPRAVSARARSGPSRERGGARQVRRRDRRAAE